MIKCRSCKKDKYIEELVKLKRSKSGYDNYCKECKNEANRKSDAKIKSIDLKSWKLKRRVYRKRVRDKIKNSNPELLKQLDRNRILIQKYGISSKEYNILYIKQNGKCAICNLTSKYTLAIDHCHTTNKIRGLLCYKCNTSLGLIKDSIDRLKSMIEYINHFKDE